MTREALDTEVSTLDDPARMAITLNGERSTWYEWDGWMFVMVP